MGWFVERAGERQRNLKTAGTIAALAWKLDPHGSLGSQEALANQLRKLDAGEAFDWWLGAKGEPYRNAVASVLKIDPTELIAWIEAARPSLDDDARWFRFEVFPGLAPLDLDSEDPYPGVPYALWRGDGPRGPTWWCAPPGAGRTLVGRWLARRHGWRFVAFGPEVAERTFIEHDGVDLPDERLPARIVVASPHPMPDRLRPLGWEEVRRETGWEIALLDWAAARLPPDGRFDAEIARMAFADGRLGASTPGGLLEALAELVELGPDLLAEGVAPVRALESWARAHAGRADRTVRPASRDWLRERGGWLLPRIELARIVHGLPVTHASVVASMPELPAASADAIREALEAGDRDAALRLLQPTPHELATAMSALRWLLLDEWGFPSRVLGHLRAAVVDLALGEVADIRTLGRLLDSREVADKVVQGLVNPKALAAWTDRLASGDASDPMTALVADGLLKAFALVADGRFVPLDGLARGLVGALRAAYGESCPDLGVGARVDDAEVWTKISWLTLHRLGVLDAPSPDRLGGWAFHAWQSLRWCDAPAWSVRSRIQGLAADTLGALMHADPRSPWAPPQLAALAALANGEGFDRRGLSRLHEISPLDVMERLCAPWAPSIEEVARLLWPAWRESGIPHEENLEKLATVWATFRGEAVEGTLARQLAKHAAMGVAIPDRLWPMAITAEPGNTDLLARAPIDVLLASGRQSLHFTAPAVWTRAPERALGMIAERVEGALDLESSPWFMAIPGAWALDVLAAVEGRARGEAKVKVREWWADGAIRDRVPGWERVWAWVRAREP